MSYAAYQARTISEDGTKQRYEQLVEVLQTSCILYDAWLMP